MTERVDFYIIKSSTAIKRWTFACRLTEKAYLRDLKIVILSDGRADCDALDEMLWTFNERSFVPHGSLNHADAAAPVNLVIDGSAAGTADLLVNLSSRLPASLDRFARIAEIIDADDERRRQGRERFKAYRELKIPLETHQLDENSDL